jgi:hypothetical protein
MVTILNPKEYKEQPVPEVGKEYHTFDDGKIKPSRHSIARVTEVIPFAEVNHKALLEEWRQEVMDCYWLYATETDYFIKVEYEDEDEPAYFVRTKDGGWFSLGFFGSSLDIDGSLYSKMIEWFGEGCLDD